MLCSPCHPKLAKQCPRCGNDEWYVMRQHRQCAKCGWKEITVPAEAYSACTISDNIVHPGYIRDRAMQSPLDKLECTAVCTHCSRQCLGGPDENYVCVTCRKIGLHEAKALLKELPLPEHREWLTPATAKALRDRAGEQYDAYMIEQSIEAERDALAQYHSDVLP